MVHNDIRDFSSFLFLEVVDKGAIKQHDYATSHCILVNRRIYYERIYMSRKKGKIKFFKIKKYTNNFIYTDSLEFKQTKYCKAIHNF